MDNNEAKILLQKTLKQFRQYSFKELQAIIGNILTFQVDGESGVQYQIEVEAFWDGMNKGLFFLILAITLFLIARWLAKSAKARS